VTHVLIAVACAAFAQPTEFEVASVKPNRLDDRIVTINVGPGGRFTARGYTLALLMQRAYGVMDWNVSGGPPWIRSDRFDISAKAIVTGNLTEQQLRPMLQRLLAERFKLKLHEDTREMPGHALVVAKGGPKLQAASPQEDHADTFRLNNTGLSGQGIAMTEFARYVAGKLGLVAVDKTGLEGFYDVKVSWKEEPDLYRGALPGVDPRDAYRSIVFAAIEEQLGLKMTAQKIAVRMLVIDSVERATEN
jgi:uncharacterized protein (TIGR03435 family)